MTEQAKQAPGVSRRGFLQGVSAAGITPALFPSPDRKADSKAPDSEKAAASEALAASPLLGPAAVPIKLTINGRAQRVTVEARTTLLEVLRERLDYTGAKQVCDRGACGACTVDVDGKTINACMLLALDADGSKITTIEGLAVGEELHPIQAAFCSEDALQCGYCTPGMLMSVRACLDKNPEASAQEIRSSISGNLCRCGTYPRVVEAALEAQAAMQAQQKNGKQSGGKR